MIDAIAMPEQPLLLLLQLTIIVVAARVAAVLMRSMRQSPAVGEICAGICLGPMVFGELAPRAFAAIFPANSLRTLALLSQLGLVLLMFQIGSEFDFGLLRQKALRRSAFGIAAASLSLPFATGVTLGYLGQPVLAPAIPRAGFALWLGVAFSITALPILGRILMDVGLERTRIGVVGITAAAVNDLVGCIAILCLGVIGKAPSVVGVFGGLLVGIGASSARRFMEWWRSWIAPVVGFVLLPVFFTHTGLRLQFGSMERDVIVWCLALLVPALATKFIAGYVSAGRLGFTRPEALALGVMMNTRGIMELVIANVGLELGLFPPSIFATLVLLAVISTFLTTPALLALLPRIRS